MVCKSFKGDGILDLFPFLKELKANGLRFHGREATNTGASRLSIHPTSDMRVMHNGEINNINSLRIYLAQNSAFQEFLQWDSGMDLADVLGHYSDTAIFSMYVSFQLSQGKSLESVLCGVFQPNDHAYVTGFVAEGPATMMIGYHDDFYFVNDSQAQRPAYLDVAKNKNGDIVAYRVGSVSNINVGTDLPDWQKVQVTPGRVNRLKAHRDSNGLITHYTYDKLSPKSFRPTYKMSTTGNQITTHLPNIDATQPYHRALEDESQKVAMGSMRQIGPFPRVATAGITNTSNSVGIDPSHNDVIFYNGEDTIALHPILSHFQHKQLTVEASVIYATRSQQDALSIIHNKEDFDAILDPILDQVDAAIAAGNTTIDLRFLKDDETPIFPRELVVKAVSNRLTQLGCNRLSESQKKVNLIVTTPMVQHAQDAFTLMNVGADFIYHPHLTGDDYEQQLDTVRGSLLTLAMRTGVSRLAALKDAGLIHYEGMQTTAALLGVPNHGGEQFSVHDALQWAVMQQAGVARDYGTKRMSDNQALTMERATMMQDPSQQSVINRILEVQKVYPIEFMPTENTSNKPIVVVMGAGPGGVSVVESLPENHFHILLVEREIIHRGGNAAYISGNHQSMYDSFLHRFNATLERPDVTYMGGARRTVREQLLQLADHVYNCTGSLVTPTPPTTLPAREFLDFAYAGDISTTKAVEIPKPFKEERKYPGVVVEGVGNVSWDVLQALRVEDERSQNPSLLFQKWRRQFESMPIYILARRGPESLLWKDDWVHGLATTNEPFRIFCDDPSELKDEFQRYWAPAEERLPANGINIVFKASVSDYDADSGVIDLDGPVSSIPFIGARIQGYVPQQSPDVLQHVVPESALGWSYKSSDMKGIMDDVTRLAAPDPRGFGSVNERRIKTSKLQDIKKSRVYIDNRMQQRIIEQLLDNRSVNDHELTQLLAVVESGNGAGHVPVTPVVTDELPATSVVDEILNRPLPDGINIYAANGDRLLSQKLNADPPSILDGIIEELGFNKDKFDCGGDGTCSQCAGAIKGGGLKQPSASETALARPVSKALGTTADSRLFCQHSATKPANIVAGPHLEAVMRANLPNGANPQGDENEYT